MQKTSTHTKRGWLVVFAASLFFFYEFIQMNIFNAIAQDLMLAFNLNAPELGRLSSMFFYANAILIFPAGILLDRFSTKKLLTTAVVICTIGTFIFSQATTYSLAAFSRFVDGIGAAFCFLSCVRLASRWFPPNKMAFVVGIVVTMAMLGGLVAQTPFAILSKAIGWRHAVLADAGLGVIIAIIIAVLVKDRPPGAQEEQLADKEKLKSLGFWRSLSLVLSNRYNWFGGIYTALVNLPVFLLGALFGIHYLVQVHGLTVVQGSYATTMFFLGVIFGSPAFGWFSDHIGRRVMPMVLGAILSLIVFLILMYVPHLSLCSLITLFFSLGFLTSSQVLSYPAIAELNPIALTGTAVSIESLVIMSSGVIFQPLFGWLLERDWNHTTTHGVSIYSVQDFNNAMIIMPMAFVLSIFIALSIKETYCQSQVE